MTFFANQGMLIEGEREITIKNPLISTDCLPSKDLASINKYLEEYKDQKALIAYIYRKYPE